MIKKIPPHHFLIGIGFALLLFSCSKKERYFRKILLNGKFEYEGLHPVNKGDVPSLNCYRFNYDGNEIKSITFLQHGKMRMGEEGFARRTYKYWDDVILVSHEDQFSLPLLIDDWFSYERYFISKNGMRVQFDHADRNYHRMGENNVSYIKFECDMYGRREKSWFYDFNDRLTKNQDGIFGIKRLFNENGFIVKAIYLNKDGKIMTGNDGSSSMKYEFDEAGNVTSVSYFNIKDQPVEIVDGMATTRWKYDQYGNKIESTFYDRFDNLVNTTQGIAINTFAYDKAGNLISRQYYDSLHRPAVFDGYARLNWFYDNEGFCKKQALFKLSGKDSIYLDHSFKLIYDPGNNLAEIRRQDASFKLIEENGVAIEKYKFDGAHNRISFHTCNADGELTAFNSRIAQVKWSYNLQGEKIETRYYNVDGDLTGGMQHEAINRFEYDSCGMVVQQSFYDSLNNLIEFDGAAIIKYKLDKNGNRDEFRFDKNGKRIAPQLNKSAVM